MSDSIEFKKRSCHGCRNDYYNDHNPNGVKQCWSLEKAEFVMRKEVHINQAPPWNQAPIKVLKCFHRPRFIYVEPKVTK